MSDKPEDTLVLSAAAPGAVARAVALLQAGRVIAFPTDTVYGLGAHALLPGAVEALYRIKGRPAHLAIPLLLADAAAIDLVCQDVPDVARELARRFWPGALSLVLRRMLLVPDVVTSGGDTVAVRVPHHALVRQLCRQLAAPLAATSANLHGQPPPVTAAQVQAMLGGRLPLILDGGACPGGIPSTVLDLTTLPPAILRRGPVTAEALAPFLKGLSV
jgi:L-threonylcarbamoyladenylate synthase